MRLVLDPNDKMGWCGCLLVFMTDVGGVEKGIVANIYGCTACLDTPSIGGGG
jgi:hypothetical protein